MSEILTRPEQRRPHTLSRRLGIVAACLFGSAANRGVRALGDVDVGVLPNEGPSESERFDRRLGIAGKMCALCQSSCVV